MTLRRLVPTAAGALLALVGVACEPGPPATFAGGSARIDPVADDPIEFGTLPPFELLDQNGRPFGSDELRGRPWVMAAIFTTCTGPCPALVASLQLVAAELGEGETHFVCVSVDPQVDTSEVLSAYARSLGLGGGRWHLLTQRDGTARVDELVRSGFKMAVDRLDEPDPDTGQRVTHDVRLVAVDRAGRIRGWYPASSEEGREALVERMRHLERGG